VVLGSRLRNPYRWSHAAYLRGENSGGRPGSPDKTKGSQQEFADAANNRNIFDHLALKAADEEVIALAATDKIRIERIVSTGQASPPGFWYDQPWTEWVLLLAGAAGLLFEDEPTPRLLKAGDYLLIPAGQRHRLEWTDATQPTVWLAVHYDLTPAASGRS
jgi:cupin 2 domain-containing protein